MFLPKYDNFCEMHFFEMHDIAITDEKRVYEYKLRTDTNYNELKLETITYNNGNEKNKKKASSYSG